MPTQTKKTTKSSASKTKGKPAAKKTNQADYPRPFRREVGALIFFFLAVFSLLGFFHVEGTFIDFLMKTMKGLIGYGVWLVIPACFIACFILATHRGRPVTARILCTLSMPLLASVFVHGLVNTPHPWKESFIQTMWQAGLSTQSGGVLGGVIAQLSVATFSQLGNTILFGFIFILVALHAFNTTFFDLAQWVFSRPAYEEIPQDEIPPAAPVSPKQTKKARQLYNVQAGDSGEATATAEAAEPPAAPAFSSKKNMFSFRKGTVPAPHEVLLGTSEQTAKNASEETTKNVMDSAIETPQETVAPSPSFSPEPVPEAQIPVQAPSPSEEKINKEDISKAAQEIQQQLSQETQTPPYQYPPLSLLTKVSGTLGGEALSELDANKKRLTDTIQSFGIDAKITNITRGPSVARYELELEQGVKLSKLTNLADDIALALGASGVRIAPIPNKSSMVGIEVPNRNVTPVSIHEVIGSQNFRSSDSKVSFAVGKDIGGNCVIGDISKMPHLLIAGTTGSGKSVCTNSLIISLLYKASPEQVRLIMIDPKMVELGIYNGIAHLLIPVVTDPKKAAGSLQWAVTEMMRRYRIFADNGVRDLASYNDLAKKTDGMETMPQIVVIIDELADLMLVAAKEVEESICRVAQMGRASGMHLIIATQRPSADVITGLMKANIPSRIAFSVSSAMESRIILDTMGAEKLVGRGDMLFAPHGSLKPTRVQGCFISDQEVSSVVNFIKRDQTASYSDEILKEIEQHAAEKEKSTRATGTGAIENGNGDYDELIDTAIDVIVESGQASVSMLQRRLKLGYARAARLVDQMEERGIVGPFEGSKPRQLLITKQQWQTMKLGSPVPEEDTSEILQETQGTSSCDTASSSLEQVITEQIEEEIL